MKKKHQPSNNTSRKYTAFFLLVIVCVCVCALNNSGYTNHACTTAEKFTFFFSAVRGCLARSKRFRLKNEGNICCIYISHGKHCVLGLHRMLYSKAPHRARTQLAHTLLKIHKLITCNGTRIRLKPESGSAYCLC